MYHRLPDTEVILQNPHTKNRLTYKSTLYACYLGYITQAIVVNLTPLFFVIFKDSFGLTNGQMGTVVLVLFAVQLAVDLASIWFVDRVGYKRCAVTAHIFAGAGLILLGILPRIMSNSYAGIMVSIVVSSVGAGLIEVLISPIVDLLPAESKASAMSLLHAFYCWGQVAVVAVSTLVLTVIGHGKWYILPILWAIVPLGNSVFFKFVPIPDPVPEEEGGSLGKLVLTKTFMLSAYLMLAAAMSEVSMSQWASYFAERGLGIPKVMGDLLGPCLFAVCMGTGRTLYGIFGAKLKLARALTSCALICTFGYLLASLVPNPAVSLAGCALIGLGVSLMWPGTLSFASAAIPGGGTKLFSLLALSGDIGCSLGPWLTGIISDAATSSGLADQMAGIFGIGVEQAALKIGLLLIVVFPITAVIAVRLLSKHTKEQH